MTLKTGFNQVKVIDISTSSYDWLPIERAIKALHLSRVLSFTPSFKKDVKQITTNLGCWKL